MRRKKHTTPEIREVLVKVGETEVRIPYMPDLSTTVHGGIPIVPRRLLKLLHLA